MPEDRIERWGVFELTLAGPTSGNPFLDVQVGATFQHLHRQVNVAGFYDGDGVYKVRFMPDTPGEWNYSTTSNAPALAGRSGGFICTAPGPGNHGPVRVEATYHFAYEDGTPHFSVGTTCYAWAHQGEPLETQTLRTLAGSPFNKLRMCVFPKHYPFNVNEPELHAFERAADGTWDTTRFNPTFFQHLERRIGQLCELGVEADLILFHPYDRWGYSTMPSEVDDRYLRYIVARLAAYRNVWWSMANEFDIMQSKTMADWDRFFKIVQESDPSQHLRSVHNCTTFYDHSKPWVTHCSIQHHGLERVGEWREQYRKPVVVDECAYEGNIPHNWGNITAEEMVHRFWMGVSRGGYVGHGETYLHPEDVLWWSKGGILHGQSPERIAFLRRVMEEGPILDPVGANWDLNQAGRGDDYRLIYFGINRPLYKELRLPAGRRFRAEVIDTWGMRITPLEGHYEGECRVALPGRPYQALRLRAID